MKKRTICWFIDIATMILFVSYYGKDAIKADMITDLISRGKDESRRYRETPPPIESDSGAAAQEIAEGGSEK